MEISIFLFQLAIVTIACNGTSLVVRQLTTKVVTM